MHAFRSWQARFAVMLLLVPAVSAATTLTWPGSPGCTGTLQACIDGSASGDRIEIVATTPIDEDLALGDHSLTLTAAPYHRPGFAPGRSISGATSGSVGSVNVSLSKLRLRDGRVTLTYWGTATGTYDVRDLEITQSAGGNPAALHVDASAGTVSATIYNNRIAGVPASLNSGLIELATRGATLNAYAAFNKLVRTASADSDGAGIFVDIAGAGSGGAGFVSLFGNEVRGSFDRAGIYFSEGLFSSTASSYAARAYENVVVCGDAFGAGIGFVALNGAIDVQAINNTVSGCDYGLSASRWEGAVTGTMSGLAWNNVLVADAGLEFNVDGAAGMINDYNLINAASNTVPLGVHTITAPAQLVAGSAPRLAAGSPAIGAADGTTLANGIIENGLPIVDADGLRRVKQSGADIGAYEFGDLSFAEVADVANTSGHITYIDNPAVNGAAGALLFPTRKAIFGAAPSDDAFGVWYATPNWTIYHEDTSIPVEPGTAWNVFVPASGAGAFVHVGTPANTSGFGTQIDDPMTNGYADRILLARHDFSLDGTYLDHPVGVYLTGSGSGSRWNIGNADQAALPIGIGFNVYAQPPSPNAFRLIPAIGAANEAIDHPLINGVACAELHVTRVFDPAFPVISADFDVEYEASTGYWYVHSPVPFVGGTSFNVVIDAAQVYACNDRIFADGFD
jgi:hypothetical protein